MHAAEISSMCDFSNMHVELTAAMCFSSSLVDCMQY